jgi:RND family efflux transporter MFP subunit
MSSPDSPSPAPDNQPQNQNDPPADGSRPSIIVDLAKAGENAVSTEFASDTGATLKIAVGLFVAVLVIAFLIVQFRRWHEQSELDAQTVSAAGAQLSVNVVTVKYGPETESLKQPGNVRAWYETTIYARVNGYLANWSADIGDHVTKGQVLATIDTPELDDQLSAAQAKLKVSQANVAVTEANTEFAKSTYERWRDSPEGVVSVQEQEQKKADYESSVAQLNAAQSQVNLDEAEVNSLTELTNFKVVRAPFDGVITARRIDIGDLVTAGSTENTTSLYSIAQYDQTRVFVDVPQNYSRQMVVNTPATILVDEYPDRQFQGHIARTSAAIDQASKELHVEVDVPNSDLALAPGMYVWVNFDLLQKPMLQVPSSALIFRAQDTQVAVVGPDGKIHFQTVTIARDDGEMVEISSGVSANDRVALNLSSQVTDGDQVVAVNADEPDATASHPQISVAANTTPSN